MSKAVIHDFETGAPSRIGYARVSTRSQDLRRQCDALGAVGCRRVYGEVVSGAAPKRPALELVRANCRPGDVVVVESWDRLGRKAAEILELCEWFMSQGVDVEAVRGGLTTATASAVLLPFVAALADAERNLIRERTRIGVDEARRRGTRLGRPRKVTAAAAAMALKLRADGYTLKEIAAALKCSRATVSRMLAGAASSTPAQTKLDLRERGDRSATK